MIRTLLFFLRLYILWLLTPKRVKNLFKELAQGIRESGDIATNVEPKEFYEIQYWELNAYRRMIITDGRYTITYHVFPYGELLILYKDHEPITHYYKKYQYIEELT